MIRSKALNIGTKSAALASSKAARRYPISSGLYLIRVRRMNGYIASDGGPLYSIRPRLSTHRSNIEGRDW